MFLQYNYQKSNTQMNLMEWFLMIAYSNRFNLNIKILKLVFNKNKKFCKALKKLRKF